MNRRDLTDQVYLNVAFEVAKLSRDKNTKVGSVIVDNEGFVVSTGRNGPPKGINDSLVPLSREEENLSYMECKLEHLDSGGWYCHGDGISNTFKINKYPIVRHAEENSLSLANKSKLKGSTIYVTHFPCPRCATQIVHHGLNRVVVPGNCFVHSSSEVDAHTTKYLFAMGHVSLKIGDEEFYYQLK